MSNWKYARAESTARAEIIAFIIIIIKFANFWRRGTNLQALFPVSLSLPTLGSSRQIIFLEPISGTWVALSVGGTLSGNHQILPSQFFLLLAFVYHF